MSVEQGTRAKCCSRLDVGLALSCTRKSYSERTFPARSGAADFAPRLHRLLERFPDLKFQMFDFSKR